MGKTRRCESHTRAAKTERQKEVISAIRTTKRGGKE
jgi:hypothetical protein